jgi:hypothetical protein
MRPRNWAPAATVDFLHGLEELTMSYLRTKLRLAREREQGKVGWILLWLLGIPIPVLLVLFLLRGCT